MHKDEFLHLLEQQLDCLPPKDRQERLVFYSDLIDDRIEDGETQDDAVAAFGDVTELASSIIADTPLLYLVKESVRPKRRMRTWEIVLLAAGSPVWLPLLIAVIAVVSALNVSLWAVLVSLWAVFASLLGTACGTLLLSVVSFCQGNIPTGTALVGIALVLTSLGILAFFGCKTASVGTVRLTKAVARSIKRCFMKKEDAQ